MSAGLFSVQIEAPDLTRNPRGWNLIVADACVPRLKGQGDRGHAPMLSIAEQHKKRVAAETFRRAKRV